MLNPIKYGATFLLITGTIINNLGHYPHGAITLATGGLLWLWAAVLMRDAPLIRTRPALGRLGGIALIIGIQD
jgi:hypothetical protein